MKKRPEKQLTNRPPAGIAGPDNTGMPLLSGLTLTATSMAGPRAFQKAAAQWPTARLAFFKIPGPTAIENIVYGRERKTGDKYSEPRFTKDDLKRLGRILAQKDLPESGNIALKLLQDVIAHIANHGISPVPSFMDHVSSALQHVMKEKRFRHRDAQDSVKMLARILQSMAILDALNPAIDLRESASHVHRMIAPQQRFMDKVAFAQYTDACLWFDFETQGHDKYLNPGTKKSKSERFVKECLKQTGHEVLSDRACYLPLLHHRLDMGALYKGKKVFIEYDGKYHFDESGRLNARTRFRSALIAKLYPDLTMVRLSINAPILRTEFNGQAITEGLETMLEQAGTAAPGIYRAKWGKDGLTFSPLVCPL